MTTNNEGKSAVVLLVDDEESFLDSTAKALLRRNFQVIKASRGMEALTLLRDHEIDVAVLDVKMPDIDGHRLFYAVQEERPGVPIIMLTGHGSLEKAFELGKHGVFEYLGKPCEIEELADCIRRALGESESCTELKVDDFVDEETTLPIRVLMVDDEAEFLTSASRALTRRGLSVTTAMDGGEALDLLQSRRIDVAVVDIKMPGIDGPTLLGKIKQINEDIEVILLTGHATINTAVSGLKNGAFDYLIKPQDIDELADKVRLAGEKKRMSETEKKKTLIKDLIEHSPT